MRTTLNLNDDVLELARDLAIRQRKSLGEVVSNLIRQAAGSYSKPLSERNGIPLFPVSQSARPVTPEMIKKLLDESS